MIDGSSIKVTINGMTECHVVLDLGANAPMIHERMVKAGQIPVDPNGRRITGITGQSHMMPPKTRVYTPCQSNSLRFLQDFLIF
jgi:hypothetical protein